MKSVVFFVMYLLLISTGASYGNSQNNHNMRKEPIIPVIPEEREEQVIRTNEVLDPLNGTILEFGQDNAVVKWYYVGPSEVQIKLYRGDVFIANLTGWIDNDGVQSVELFDSSNSSASLSGEYRILITSRNADGIWSDYFEIRPMSMVIRNTSTSRIASFELEWECLAEPVDIILYRIQEGNRIAERQFSAYNYSYQLTPDDFPEEGEYQVRIVDGLGASAQSGVFEVGLNDTPDNPTYLMEGTYSSNLFKDSDVDYYSFSALAGREYQVTYSRGSRTQETSLSIENPEIGSTLLHVDEDGTVDWIPGTTGYYLFIVNGGTGEYSLGISEKQEALFPDWIDISIGPNLMVPTGKIGELLKPSFGGALAIHLFNFIELGLNVRSQNIVKGVLEGGLTHYSEISQSIGAGVNIYPGLGFRAGIGYQPTARSLSENYVGYEEFNERLSSGIYFYASGIYDLSKTTTTGGLTIRADFCLLPGKRSHLQFGLLMNFK